MGRNARGNTTAKYQTYADILIEAAESKGISYDSLLDRQLARISELKENRGLTAEELHTLAYDETIAEMSETMLTDTDAAQRVSQELYKQDRTLWEKIKDFFTGLVEKLRSAYKGIDPDSDMGRVMKRAISDNEKVAQAWAEAVVEAGENYQLQDGQKNNARVGERFSARQYQEDAERFAQEIDKWNRDGMESGVRFELGSTGEILQGLGAIESDIYMNGDKIQKILQEHPEITLNEIKQIPQILNDPTLILKSRNVGRGERQNTRMVLFGSVKGQNGMPVLTVFDLRPSENHFVLNDMQKVTSAYTKTNGVSFLENSFVLYADKKRTTSLLRTIGFQMPIELLQSGFIGNISYNKQNVNLYGEKFSNVVGDTGELHSSRNVQNTSENQTETENFKKWFGDWQKNPAKASKVVNEDGTPKVVYHGSPADFNTFSLKYLGTNGTNEGYGFYFTDDKEIAESYSKGTEAQRHQGADGKLFEVYLDIKKPLSDTEVTMRRSEFRKFLMEMNKQVDEDGEPLDFLSNYGDVSWEGLQSVINSAMRAEYDGSDSDVNMIHSIINGCGNMEMVFNVLRKTTGYDGIIVKDATWGGDQTIYIAFHPNQIKSAMDNVGTFDKGNPDIRYSNRNSQESQVERLARKNEELKAEAEYLRQVVQIQKKGNTRNLRDRESVNAVAKSILDSINAKDGEFGKKLNDFYRDMVTVEMDYDTMRERAGVLADRALEHHQAERDGYAQEVLDFLKRRRVSLRL